MAWDGNDPRASQTGPQDGATRAVYQGRAGRNGAEGGGTGRNEADPNSWGTVVGYPRVC